DSRPDAGLPLPQIDLFGVEPQQLARRTIDRPPVNDDPFPPQLTERAEFVLKQHASHLLAVIQDQAERKTALPDHIQLADDTDALRRRRFLPEAPGCGYGVGG